AMALVSVALSDTRAGAQPAPSTPAQPAPGQPPPGQPAPAPSAPAGQPAVPAGPLVPLTAPANLPPGDAIAPAPQNNPTIRHAALGVSLARYQLNQAEAQKALTLGGSISFTQNSVAGGAPLSGTITIPGTEVIGLPFTTTGTSGGTPYTQWNYALTMKYPLYTGGALEAQIDIAPAHVAGAGAPIAPGFPPVVLLGPHASYLGEPAPS